MFEEFVTDFICSSKDLMKFVKDKQTLVKIKENYSYISNTITDNYVNNNLIGFGEIDFEEYILRIQGICSVGLLTAVTMFAIALKRGFITYKVIKVTRGKKIFSYTILNS